MHSVLRWWGIRHLRYWWYACLLHHSVKKWQDYGGRWYTQCDTDTLEAIWRGDA